MKYVCLQSDCLDYKLGLGGHVTSCNWGRSPPQPASVKGIKVMVHLIHKLNLKAVFLWVKYNDAVGFGQKSLYFR